MYRVPGEHRISSPVLPAEPGIARERETTSMMRHSVFDFSKPFRPYRAAFPPKRVSGGLGRYFAFPPDVPIFGQPGGNGCHSRSDPGVTDSCHSW